MTGQLTRRRATPGARRVAISAIIAVMALLSSAASCEGKEESDGAQKKARRDTTAAAPSAPATTAAVADTATITITVAASPGGRSISVAGRGFRASESVVIYLDSDVAATIPADASGAFTKVIPVPAGLAAGAHAVLAKGATSEREASGSVTL